MCYVYEGERLQWVILMEVSVFGESSWWRWVCSLSCYLDGGKRVQWAILTEVSVFSEPSGWRWVCSVSHLDGGVLSELVILMEVSVLSVLSWWRWMCSVWSVMKVHENMQPRYCSRIYTPTRERIERNQSIQQCRKLVYFLVTDNVARSFISSEGTVLNVVLSFDL